MDAWYHTNMGYWEWQIRVHCRVLKMGRKVATIEMSLKNGTTTIKRVSISNLTICPTPQEVMNQIMVLG